LLSNSSLNDINRSPIAVGGVGGSGSRLVAQILMGLGFHMGDDLNDANDNLWFTLLFKRIEILSAADDEFENLMEIFINGMTGSRDFTESQTDLINALASMDRSQHPAAWLKVRARSLLSAKNRLSPMDLWGWKEPNTHIVIDRLIKALPGLKYVHVVRNGLDMAYSENQNQLKLWGKSFLGKEYPVSPYYSLRYWRIVHERVLTLGATMGQRFLFLNFDQLCQDPNRGVKEILEFLSMDVSNTQFKNLTYLVKPPASIGRFKQYGINMFDSDDVSFLKQLGFDTGIG
jgi:hypothetical protein